MKRTALFQKLCSLFLVLAVAVSLFPAFGTFAQGETDDPIALAPSPGMTVSSVFSGGYGADRMIDDQLGDSRWNSAQNTFNGEWLIANFGEEVTLSRVSLLESTMGLTWIASFDVQYWSEEQNTWITAAVGGSFTNNVWQDVALSPAVTARWFRIVFTDISGKDCFNVTEIKFYDAAGNEKKLPNRCSVKGSDLPLGASCSSIFSADYNASFAFDGSDSTRWNSQPGTYNDSWLGFNFGETRKISQVRLFETTNASITNVCSWELKMWTESGWETFVSGDALGTSPVSIELEAPVYADKILFVADIGGKDCYTLSEITFFDGLEQIPCRASGSLSGAYSPECAFDGSQESRWVSDGTDGSWIMAHFGEEVTLDSVKLYEALNSIASFHIETMNGEYEAFKDSAAWTTCYTGTTVGTELTCTFTPVKATAVKIVIDSVSGDAPSFYDIEFSGEGKKVLPLDTAETYNTNLALDKGVLTSGSIENATWNSKNLTNGVIEAEGGFTTFGMGADSEMYVGVDLSRTTAVDEVVLYSARWNSGVDVWSGVPRSLTVEFSHNGNDWFYITEAETSPLPNHQQAVSVTFDTVYARFIRVRSDDLYGKLEDDGNTRHYIQLAEMEVYAQRCEVLEVTDSFQTFCQVRPGQTSDLEDMRILLVVDPTALAAYDSVNVEIRFTCADRDRVITGVLGGKNSTYELYRTVLAAGSRYTVNDNYGIFGNVVTDIPVGAYSGVTVTITAPSGEVLFTASR